jgi:para-aminobenzoate synthetase component 1
VVSARLGVGLLELHEPAGAFDRLEAHLRAAGFFIDGGAAAAGRSADIFLGYGLSEPLRRGGAPARPEPVALPVAACRIVEAGAPQEAHGSTAWDAAWQCGPWEPTWMASGYRTAVRQAREAIAAGEVYQVNLVQHLSAPFHGDPTSAAVGLAEAMAAFRPLHARPFHGLGWSVVSASPELFLARRGQRLWTMPIKGTRPRGAGHELATSAKDAAEHVMIVDLERNDLGAVCEPGSVGWPDLLEVRAMAGVEHLVSRVEGTVRAHLSWAAIVRAMFPGGSVTGAPKIAALDHINALEPVGRGASMGALGRVWPNGDFELALTIRTFAVAAERVHLWVGGGVVWDSDPSSEVEESWTKARPLLAAIEHARGTRARG